ncbi:MAG TPA: hypothetical protein VF113_03475 [Stellaceae bacterium]
MKTAIALAGLVALFASSANAACYGGPAVQTCHEPYREGDTVDGSAGITTMRGYNAQHGVEWNEAATGSSNQSPRKASAHGSARIDRTAPRHQSFFYVCTPYRGCS